MNKTPGMSLAICLFTLGLTVAGTARAATDGYFDTTWAGAGHITFNADPHQPLNASGAQRIIVEPGGNLLLAGYVAGANWWLGELRANGQPVLTFGESDGSGLITSCALSGDLCASTNGISSIAREVDGSIVLPSGTSGLSRVLPGAHAMDAVGVLGGNGVPASGAGSVSIYGTPINNVGGVFSSLATLKPTSSGKWLLAGSGFYTGSSGSTDPAVIRLNGDFSLDTGFNADTDSNGATFAGGQIVLPSFGAGDQTGATAMVVQPDGRIIVIGALPDKSIGVVRLLASGARDASYAARTLLWPLSGTLETTYSPQSALLDRAGRILILARAFSIALGEGVAIVRLLADGTPDASFGSDSVSFQSFQDTCPIDVSMTSLTLDSAGRILLAGSCTYQDTGLGQYTYFFVARFFGDTGLLDTSFGINGHSFGAFGSGPNQLAKDIALDASGRPVIVGTSGALGNNMVGVARLAYDLIYTSNFETVPRGRLPGQ